jgi:16S rRNA (guanine527-N7)-methyltransferase
MIRTAAAAWNQPMSEAQEGLVARYFDLLLVWNGRINLTGAGSVGDLVDGHLPDSFALSRLVPPDARVADIGAGGGLPGIPLAIVRPDCHVTLVEPRAKRVAFLRAAVRELGLGAAVTHGRLEAAGSAAFDVADSRATFDPATWLQAGRRLVREGGRIVVFASREVRREGFESAVDVAYVSGTGAPRWAGAFVPRGT